MKTEYSSTALVENTDGLSPQTAAKGGFGPEAPERRPLIPAGTYRAMILKYEIHDNPRFPTNKKLHLHLEVFVDGPGTDGVILPRFLNYYGKPGTGTDYYKEWVKVNGNKAPDRRDRMTPRVFVDRLVEVRVKTVKNDCDGDPVDGDLRYSVVSKILGSAK
jgi:hypothetical protein